MLQETRNFTASCNPDLVTAEQLLMRVRDHWHVENCLHFTKDRWWDEDRHYTARPGLAEVLATLTNSALTVLRACYPPDHPLRALADYIQWSPARGLKLLGLT